MSHNAPKTAIRKPRRNERKERRRGESYVEWLGRTLWFARYHGKGNSDGSWSCGYCAVDRHEDCIVDCGCPDPRCQPHSSGTTGGGYPRD